MIWDMQSIPFFSFFLFKALEDGGKYHLYSYTFSKCKRYAEMICKLFEKNCTTIEMNKNIFNHLEFALTWPTMSYLLTVQCMLWFFFMNNFFIFLHFLSSQSSFLFLLKCNINIYDSQFFNINKQVMWLLHICIMLKTFIIFIYSTKFNK